MNLVELGEVAAGVVYATDAAASKEVTAIYTFDDNSHDPIRYPLVLLKHGEQISGGEKVFRISSQPNRPLRFSKNMGLES